MKKPAKKSGKKAAAKLPPLPARGAGFPPAAAAPMPAPAPMPPPASNMPPPQPVAPIATDRGDFRMKG